MPLISFIVPVYNTKKYIENCINSIVNQKFTDWEIILVDDHSTDGSLELCQEISKNDSRINLYQMEKNSGPGEARNYGLTKVKGKYIYFLDSDDSIEKGALESLTDLMKKTKNAEMIFVKHREIFGSKELEYSIEDNNQNMIFKNYDEFILPFMKDAKLGFYLWQFVYNREFLDKHGYKFRKSKMGEDIDFVLKYLFKAKRIVEYNHVLNVYRIRISGSLSTTSGHIKNWHHIVRSAAETLKLAKKDKYSSEQKKWIIKNVIFLLKQFESIAGSVDETELHKARKEFELFHEMLPYLKEYIYENGLLHYINLSGWRLGAAQFCLNKYNNLKKLVENRKEKDCYVFPATRKSTRLIGILEKYGYRFKGMLDNDVQKIGLLFDGYVILSPSIIPHCYDDNNKLFVVVYTATEQTGKILANQLCSYGLIENVHFVCAGYDEE